MQGWKSVITIHWNVLGLLIHHHSPLVFTVAAECSSLLYFFVFTGHYVNLLVH